MPISRVIKMILQREIICNPGEIPAHLAERIKGDPVTLEVSVSGNYRTGSEHSGMSQKSIETTDKRMIEELRTRGYEMLVEKARDENFDALFNLVSMRENTRTIRSGGIDPITGTTTSLNVSYHRELRLKVTGLAYRLEELDEAIS